MTLLLNRRPGDWWAMSATLVVVGIELAICEYFHQMSTEAVRMAMLLGVWVALSFILLVLGSKGGRARAMSRRLVVMGGAAMAFYLLAWPGVHAAIDSSTAPRLWTAGMVLAGIAVVALSLRVGELRWVRFRWAIAVACFLFVGSEGLAGRFLSHDIAWPPVQQNPTQAASAKGATVFLLLDELSATSAPAFVDVLRERGLPVALKAVPPVANATARVVPELFTERPFAQSKPCGLTSICSGSDALDFSRTKASRSDIDIVGFYMPYCAIQGLRSCARLAPPFPLIDLARWKCGVLRRLDLGRGPHLDDCLRQQAVRWTAFVDEAEQAIWRAPLWQEGGLMYAHLPLPHPPGPTPGGSLKTHYEENVRKAVRLVRDIVDRSRQAGHASLRLVIFSDHPLRSMWCTEWPPYRANGCPISPELVDSRVPVIVAGDPLPDIGWLDSNRLVFRIGTR